MGAPAKTNGHAKTETTTPKPAITKKLVEQAVKPETQPAPEPVINLEERIDRFEKLRGITTQRERLVQTLTELARFNYNSSDSCSFYMKDSTGLEFKTTNSNLIKLISDELQHTLETKKTDLENQIIGFML